MVLCLVSSVQSSLHYLRPPMIATTNPLSSTADCHQRQRALVAVIQKKKACDVNVDGHTTTTKAKYISHYSRVA
jgi:hypothetical protein